MAADPPLYISGRCYHTQVISLAMTPFQVSLGEPAWEAAINLNHAILSHFAAERRMPRLVEFLCETLHHMCRESPQPLVQLVHSPLLCAKSASDWEDGFLRHTTSVQLHDMAHEGIRLARECHVHRSFPTLLCMTHLLTLMVPCASTENSGLASSLFNWAATCIAVGADACEHASKGPEPLALALGLRLRARLQQRGYDDPHSSVPRDRLAKILEQKAQQDLNRLEAVRVMKEASAWY